MQTIFNSHAQLAASGAANDWVAFSSYTCMSSAKPDIDTLGQRFLKPTRKLQLHDMPGEGALKKHSCGLQSRQSRHVSVANVLG